MFNPIEAFRRYAAKHGYLTAPVKSEGMPPGIPYIVGNEGAERFSFYGMRAILVIFMTQYMMTHSGKPDHLNEIQARIWFHNFTLAVYLTPLAGSLIADGFIGKYRTIIWLSLVYCLGHLVLALDDTRLGLISGLALISVGAGGIKPCVSAHVGDQFGASNARFLPRVFSWFYFSINLGSAISTLLIPMILAGTLPEFFASIGLSGLGQLVEAFKGSHCAFAVPGILMLVATIVFWMGRNKFVHIPPSGFQFVKDTFSRESLRIVGRLAILYIFIAMFWALFDQTSSSWVLQAEHMNRRFLGINWLSSQLQAVNPVLILVFIPIFSYIIYPAIDKVFPLTPLRKIGIGLFVAVPSFLIPAWVEMRITQGAHPNIIWQILAYVLITAAEVLISITALEFSYTQAPKRMKSFIMGIFMCSTSVGDGFVSLVNIFIQNPDGSSKLPGAQYYMFFAYLMLGFAILYIIVSQFFRVQTFIQDEEPSVAPQPVSAS